MALGHWLKDYIGPHGGGEGGSSSGGGTLIVEATYDLTNDCLTLQSTWQEISDAFKAGACQVHWEVAGPSGTAEHNVVINSIFSGPAFGGGNSYSVEIPDYTCTCTSPSDYPSSCSGGGTGPSPDLGN